MSLTSRLLPACVILSAVFLALPFSLVSIWEGFAAVFLGAAFWLFAWWKKWHSFAGWLVAFNSIFAALGMLISSAFYISVAGVIFTLAAWDLESFYWRTRIADHISQPAALERQHLIRLAIVSLLSFAVTGMALLIRLPLAFGWVFLVALVLILSITLLVNQLRKIHNNEEELESPI